LIYFYGYITTMKKVFKRHGDYGFFDQDLRLSKLIRLGDPLEKLKNGIDFEMFRAFLEERLTQSTKGKGSRPPYDYVLMFKVLILQRYYYLSEDQVEYQINDRMSFMRFLNLTIADDVPDSKTIWLIKEKLTDLELIEQIFKLFINQLDSLGLIVNEGKIVDTSFVEVPRQRNTRVENKQIKEGETPDSFKKSPNKIAQKDTDARWTKKNFTNYYGYKNHVKTVAKSKPITKYMVTDASVQDSQVIDELLDEKDKGEDFYADNANTGTNQEETISKKEMTNQVCEKGKRNKPLTVQQMALP
jgi:transposase, IS5 family